MTDLITALRAHAKTLRVQADRYEQAAQLIEQGDDAGGLLASRVRALGEKNGKRPKPKPEGENRRPLSERAARKARGLAMLKEGKTVKEVAKAFGVTESLVYLWRKSSR